MTRTTNTNGSWINLINHRKSQLHKIPRINKSNKILNTITMIRLQHLKNHQRKNVQVTPGTAKICKDAFLIAAPAMRSRELMELVQHVQLILDLPREIHLFVFRRIAIETR